MGILGLRTSADHPLVLGVRMRAMLLSSLTVVAFSILPIILDRYGASPDVVWTASSLVLFVVAASYISWFTASLRALGQAEISTTRFQRVVILPTLLLTSAGLGVLLVTNVVLSSPGLYLTALALLLFQSGFTFCLIVFSFLPRVDPIYERVEGDESNLNKEE